MGNCPSSINELSLAAFRSRAGFDRAAANAPRSTAQPAGLKLHKRRHPAMRNHDAPIRGLKYLFSIAVLVMWVSAGVELRADQTIVIRSGNASIGTQDSLVHALPYGTTG